MDLATPLSPISFFPPSPPPRLAESRSQSRSPIPSTQSFLKSVSISSEEEGCQSPRMIPPRILLSPPPLSRSTPLLSPTPRLPAYAAPPAFIHNSSSAPMLQTDMSSLPPRAGPISTVSVPHESIERVERELAAEQLRLQEGEQQLAELQNVLQELHEQHRVSNVRQ